MVYIKEAEVKIAMYFLFSFPYLKGKSKYKEPRLFGVYDIS